MFSLPPLFILFFVFCDSNILWPARSRTGTAVVRPHARSYTFHTSHKRRRNFAFTLYSKRIIIFYLLTWFLHSLRWKKNVYYYYLFIYICFTRTSVRKFAIKYNKLLFSYTILIFIFIFFFLQLISTTTTVTAWDSAANTNASYIDDVSTYNRFLYSNGGWSITISHTFYGRKLNIYHNMYLFLKYVSISWQII